MSSLRAKSEDTLQQVTTANDSNELARLPIDSAFLPKSADANADSTWKRRPGERALEVAFNTIAAAHGVKNLFELNALFRPAIEELGFSAFAAIKLARPSGRIQVSVLFGDGFEAWLERYLKKRYAEHDCIIERCFKATEPFCWTEVLSSTAVETISPRAYRVEGSQAGAVAPVRKPDGSVFVALFVGHLFDSRDPIAVTASHLLASYYGIAGGHFYASEQLTAPRASQLTNRQIECLRWIRAGKTSAEIGELVGISARVVNEHVWGACKRLGVRTRAQAVLAASSAGFLD